MTCAGVVPPKLDSEASAAAPSAAATEELLLRANRLGLPEEI